MAVDVCREVLNEQCREKRDNTVKNGIIHRRK